MHSAGTEAQFEQIVRYLHQTRGFDFTAYKRTTLLRRVLKRMHAVGSPTFDEYFDFLQLHQEEFAALFNTILINVTSFYRDPDVWAYLSTEVLPPLIRNDSDGAVRVWSAGCATGQEPYTVAMAMAELLGEDEFRARVKVYGTDVDEEALAVARAGVYAPRMVDEVPAELLAKYFDRTQAGFSFKREFRRSIIFGRHDLLQDAPISRVDLLLCRNTLMYLNSDAQSRVVSKLFFALKPSGYVLLGRAELLLSHAPMFTTVDLKRRLFRAVPKPSPRDRLFLLAQTGRDVMIDSASPSRLREVAFETESVPQIVLDPAGTVVAATSAARLFGVGPEDAGRPLQDLDVSYRPVELRAAVRTAVQDRRPVTRRDVEWNRDGQMQYFDVEVAPVIEDGVALGTRITFVDVTAMKALQNQLQQSKQELETAYEELQSTNEELETTNEELQSTVEELETTNEELQSTNEELETMNEELQSTNEELQTMNDELRSRSTDLNVANAFLESVFSSLRSAVLVVDREYRIEVWNPRAADLWGLRSDEACGTQLPNLDIGLPVAELEQPLRDVLSGSKDHAELVLPATSRRGKPIECRVSIIPMRDSAGALSGGIIMMDEQPA